MKSIHDVLGKTYFISISIIKIKPKLPNRL